MYTLYINLCKLNYSENLNWIPFNLKIIWKNFREIYINFIDTSNLLNSEDNIDLLSFFFLLILFSKIWMLRMHVQNIHPIVAIVLLLNDVRSVLCLERAVRPCQTFKYLTTIFRQWNNWIKGHQYCWYIQASSLINSFLKKFISQRVLTLFFQFC